MKRLMKMAAEENQMEELINNLEKFKTEVLDKFDKILEDNAELIEEISIESMHTEYEKDIDVLINENKENLMYVKNKFNQIQQKINEKFGNEMGGEIDEQD